MRRTTDALAPLGIMWATVGAIVATAAWFDVRMTQLTKDPIALFQSDRFYYGMLSNLGMVLWTAAASIGLFTAALLHSVDEQAEAAAYLRSLGLLTAVLMLDDLFMIHELVGPVFLGLPELLFYGCYALGMAWVLIRFRRTIVARSAYGVLALALGLFAASTFLDWTRIADIGTDVEDGLKTAAIIAYFYYCLITATDCLRGMAAGPHLDSGKHF